MRPTLNLSVVVALAFAAGFALSSCSKTPPAAPTLKNEGEACIKDEDCTTGLCEGIPGTATLCVRKCTGGCQANEICSQLTTGRFSCVKDRGGLCTSCTLDTDCPYPADKCIVIDGRGVCGRDCAFNQNCPTSYRCLQGIGTDGKAKSQQCTPASGSCTCTSATAGQMVACSSTNSLGTCTGYRTCDGVSGFDNCSARIPQPEVCNGVDDNCNGSIDENMGSQTCGVGACKRTVDTCTDGGVVACVEGKPGLETCNGIDDDCDGITDNGSGLLTDVMNCGKCGNACTVDHATPKCTAGTCLIQQCDVGFANCNSLDVDGCEVNTKTSIDHCGGCGKKCDSPGSDATCNNGSCEYQCKPGFIDLDGKADNGCEYQCTPVRLPDGGVAIDVPDVDMIDANCDGFDGDATNGIFVSDRTGDDTNIGDMENPVQTIQKGVELAVAQNKRDVYVSQPFSSYAGPVDLTNVKGKIIAGAYAVATPRWKRDAANGTAVFGGNPALIMNASHGTIVQHLSFRSDDAVGFEANGNGKNAYGAVVTNTADAGFQKITVQAGKGAAGAPGVAGGGGAVPSPFSLIDGKDGQAGAVDDGSDLCNGHSPPRVVGAGGVSACGRNGGAGGDSGRDDGNPGFAGQDGIISVGSAGQGNPNDNEGTAWPTSFGKDGASGTKGDDGARSSNVGSLTAAGYLGPIGGGGKDGSHGNGGGGGGGGGGGCDYILDGLVCKCSARGSAGGGGGAGGCAGSGGTPGGSGGASIALLMYKSSARAVDLKLRAGAGGTGGNGGGGGTGSNGGAGGKSPYFADQQFTAGRGGDGGKGGKGGDGGGGAGGAGGASFGYLHDSTARINTSELTISTGSQGNPGLGGGTGNDGPYGKVETDQSL